MLCAGEGHCSCASYAVPLSAAVGGRGRNSFPVPLAACCSRGYLRAISRSICSKSLKTIVGCRNG